MVVHARTLEFYRQLGFAEDVLAAGIKVESARVRKARTNGSVGRVHLQFRDIGRGLSPYPFALAYPQDDHGRFLVTKLREAGADVEWSTRLKGFGQDNRSVRAIIATNNGQMEEVTAEHLCGCDGAHSVVRERLAVGFQAERAISSSTPPT
jgi:2-polyprenyl-6-methoxyphenol hydroxylase-like FAD-dependent oxidoreductase